VAEYVPVAEVNSLAEGQGRSIHVRGREFALFHLEGQFYAIDNTCPHRAAPLGAGYLERGCVYCPMHGWQFDVKTGACINVPDRPVRSYRTQVANGQVMIEIEP
jgi:nitrite reductase (NADH) small subunit/3-phenylpropionate/trans-cinnamate dioxygenase ferredoxin subunit